MIRRVAVVSALVLLAGCSLKDAFSSHEDVVARAAGQELTAERLASLLAPVKQVPLRREVIDRIAELWVDYQLLGQAIAAGDSLTDSATVADASWPFIAQLLANRLHDTLVAGTRPTPQQVDSVYNGADWRYVQHILIAVRDDTTDAVKAAKRQRAQQVLAQVRGGADFARLAGQVSDDPGSKANGGRLGLIPRGAMVKAFEDAAFALQPGQISDLVPTAFGYHIIWRPELSAVRDSFAEMVTDLLAQRFDSLFLDSLMNSTRISVRGGAANIVRAAAQNLRLSKERSRTLATYTGGKLEEKDFARWLQAFPPQTRGQVQQAPDSTLIEFVKSIVRNEMLLRTATQRGVQLLPADWDTLRSQFRQQIGMMLTGMGIAPESLAADTASGGRAAAAAQRVDAYFTAMVEAPGTRPYFEVPPFLGDVLRSRYTWHIAPAGVGRALERAQALRGPEPQNTLQPLQPAPVQPSPGGPPLPGN
jgi:peptidyl-prolyl cis-trans isomerase D